MHAILTDGDYARAYREFGRRYPGRGYGSMFKQWIISDDMGPYEGWGNGALMRVGPVGWAFSDTRITWKEGSRSAAVTHNSDQAMNRAGDVARDIYGARTVLAGTCEEADGPDGYRQVTPEWVIRTTVAGYSGWRRTRAFDLSCNGTMDDVREVLHRCKASRYAAKTFLKNYEDAEYVSFERVIQTAISIGGDTDTIACVAGSLYGPIVSPSEETVEFVLGKLTPALLAIVNEFGDKYAKQ